jgi:hypothetical protein
MNHNGMMLHASGLETHIQNIDVHSIPAHLWLKDLANCSRRYLTERSQTHPVRGTFPRLYVMMRKDRQQREALRRDCPDQAQHGEERQEDGMNEEQWERDLYEEWLRERGEERGTEENDGVVAEALDVVV